MDINDRSANPVRPRRPYLRWWLFVAAASFGGFLYWCGGDWLYVRDIYKGEAALLLFPIAVLGTGIPIFRHEKGFKRIAIVFLAMIASFIGAVVLVMFFGIPFHFWIGGKL